jgi:hypothetical protein
MAAARDRANERDDHPNVRDDRSPRDRAKARRRSADP